MNAKKLGRIVLFIVLPAAVVLAILFTPGWAPNEVPLVVYCAHDARYAETILDQFVERTGIPVQIRYDTEATKSLGLTELIAREAENPRCDVFWNNQLLGTADLARRGLLEPYKGAGWERIPAGLKDPQGRYTGFAARLRVLAYNEKHATRDEALAFDPARDGGSRFAIAKPMYGTTLSHFTVLWDAWGGERLKAQHAAWRDAGVVFAGGNEQTARLVTAGTCRFAWTDSSDVAVDQQHGLPVAMVPARVGEDGRVVCLPNTVAIVKGTNRPEAARRLVEFLLSAEVELALAKGPSRQIPLGPVDESELPEQVHQLKQWSERAYPLDGLVEARAACLAWLKEAYLE